MAARWHNRLKQGLVLLGWTAVVVGPFVSHVAITTGRVTAVAIVVAAVQAGALAVVSLRQAGGWQRALGIVAAIGLGAMLALKLMGSQEAGKLGLIASSGLSHAVIYTSLLLLFGQSLRPGRTALVTGLAQRLRGRLVPAMVDYTRNVTKAWCVFFLAQLAGSATLLALAPDWAWSLFVNVLDGPAVAAMFLAEFAIRRWRFRDEQHFSPLAVARSFVRTRTGG